MKIALYGHGGSQNHGNEAIARGLHELFPDADYQLFTFHNSIPVDKKFNLDEIAEIKYFTRTFPWNKTEKFKKFIHRNDKNYEYKKFFSPFLHNIEKDRIYFLEAGDQYCEPGEHRKWYAFLNKKIRAKGAVSVMLGCSITEDVINEPEVLKDLKNYSVIIARKSLTYNLLKKAGLENTYLAPCPAFAMPAEKCVLPECFDNKDVIGFNAGFLQQGNEIFSDILLENYKNAIEYVLNSTGSNILLIPHVNWSYEMSDSRTLEKLYALYKDTNRVFMLGEKSAPQVKYILSKLKAFVALRTHAQIPAIASKVPTIIAGYKHKSIGISKDIYGENSPLLAHVQSLDNTFVIKEKLEYLLNNYEECKTFLENKIPSYVENLSVIQKLITDSGVLSGDAYRKKEIK